MNISQIKPFAWFKGCLFVVRFYCACSISIIVQKWLVTSWNWLALICWFNFTSVLNKLRLMKSQHHESRYYNVIRFKTCFYTSWCVINESVVSIHSSSVLNLSVNVGMCGIIVRYFLFRLYLILPLTRWTAVICKSVIFHFVNQIYLIFHV